MIKSPYEKYQQSSVQTKPEQLLIMLYDGAIKFLKLGIEGIEQRRYDYANTNLIKAQAIINELVASLDMSIPVSNNLSSIYEYMSYQMIQANVKKSSAPAIEVLEYLQDLKIAWQKAIKETATSNRSNYA